MWSDFNNKVIECTIGIFAGRFKNKVAPRARLQMQTFALTKHFVRGFFHTEEYTFPRAVDEPPAEVLLVLGSAFFRNGERDDAETQWKAAIEVSPKLGEGHNNLAVIYMQTDRFDLAEREITLAEQSGFRVNPQFKDDLRKRRAGR